MVPPYDHKIKRQISNHLFYHKRPPLTTPSRGKCAEKRGCGLSFRGNLGILFFRRAFAMHNPPFPRQTMVKHQEVKHMERKNDRENQRRERQPQRENDRRDQNLTNCKDR